MVSGHIVQGVPVQGSMAGMAALRGYYVRAHDQRSAPAQGSIALAVDKHT